MKITKLFAVSAALIPMITLASSKYADITSSDWVKPYLDQIVSDHPSALRNVGDFNPQSNLTRAEAAKLILNVAGLDTTKKFTYSKYTKADIQEGDWKYDILEAARYHKVMSGQVYRDAPKDLYYHPNNPVTRCEFAKMSVNALCSGEDGCQIAQVPEQEQRANDQFLAFKETLKNHSAVSGEDFRCDDAIKRNEAIKVLAKLDKSEEVEVMKMTKPQGATLDAQARQEEDMTLDRFLAKLGTCEIGAVYETTQTTPLPFIGDVTIRITREITEGDAEKCTYRKEFPEVLALETDMLEDMAESFGGSEEDIAEIQAAKDAMMENLEFPPVICSGIGVELAGHLQDEVNGTYDSRDKRAECMVPEEYQDMYE